MMYRHTVTVYDKDGKLLAKIPDKINLAQFGHEDYTGENYLGGPVEAAFSSNGKILWVSNYNMIGQGFDNPGCDGCNGKSYDPGFVYKINTQTFQIENVIKVGAVPKYLAIDRKEEIMIVSNWSSADISIVDLKTEKEIKRIDIGAHPRGIAITSDSKKAYVTVMGSTKIACVNLLDDSVEYIENVGKSPRHVVLSNNDSLLYVAVNSANSVLKYNVHTKEKQYCNTNSGPRTMILSPDQENLYVVNYFANTFSKIKTDSMKVCEVVETGHHPIGITANWKDAEIWVACYEGKLEIFKDFQLAKSIQGESFIFENELASFLQLFQYNLKENNSSDVAYHVETSSSTQTKTSTVKIEDDEKEEVIVPIKATPKATNNTISKFDPSAYPKKQTNQTTTTTTSESNSTSCAYHVIVGSFSVPENAESFLNTIKSKGYSGQLIPTSKGLTYVSAKCFDSREAANGELNSINQHLDVHGWILKKS